MATSTVKFTQEKARLDKLQQARYSGNERREAEQHTKAMKPPSVILYGALMFLAFMLDVVDLLEFTGVGLILTKFLQVFATIFFVTIAFFVNKKIKRMRNSSQALAKRMTHMRQRAAKTLRIARKIAPKTTRVLARNPVVKNIVGNILEFIPFLAALPFQMVTVYFTYKDHKKTYMESIASVKSFNQAQAMDVQARIEKEAREYKELLQEASMNENPEPAT